MSEVLNTAADWVPAMAPNGRQGYVWIVCARPLVAAVVIVNDTRKEVKASVIFEDKPAPVTMLFAVVGPWKFEDAVAQAKHWCHAVARLDGLI